MPAPIPHALSALQQAFRIPARRVVRADANADGTVWMEVRMGGLSRWFRKNGVLSEAFPADDAALPLCGLLPWRAGSVDVISWRPGRRITVSLRDSRESPFVLKGLRSKRVERTYDAYSRVHDALHGTDGFVVPHVELDEDRSALLMQRLPLDPVRLSPSAEPIFFQVGTCLARFQREVPIDGLDRHEFHDELQVLERLAERHTVGMGVLPADWHAVYASLRELELPARGRRVATHRDLHDGQILHDGERVALLDFDLLCSASPLLDVANLSAHLMLRSLQGARGFSQHSAEGCGRALLMGFSIEPSGPDYHELRAYQASTFLRLALVYSLRPQWQGLSEPLLRYAQRCSIEARQD